VPQSLPPDTSHNQPARKPRRPIRILLLDHEAADRARLLETIDTQATAVVEAATVEQADRLLEEGSFDIAFVTPSLPDGSGIDFAARLQRDNHSAQSIVMTDDRSLENAVASMRAGISDLITKPVQPDELGARFRAAVKRNRADRKHEKRIRRLRRLCQKLNQARVDVSRQVDILCSDLVTAYYELAEQVNQAQQTDGYQDLVHDELDLEGLLKQTLSYLLKQTGPTNAAIFMPGAIEGYTLGGYVNYDCNRESADFLLDHLADVVAPRLADHEGVMHVTDNESLGEWIGDDAAYLEDSHVMGIRCVHQDETLALIVLFRDGSEPFHRQVAEQLQGLAPSLADHLAKIIRIHHRHLPEFNEAEEDDDMFGLAG